MKRLRLAVVLLSGWVVVAWAEPATAQKCYSHAVPVRGSPAVPPAGTQNGSTGQALQPQQGAPIQAPAAQYNYPGPAAGTQPSYSSQSQPSYSAQPPRLTYGGSSGSSYASRGYSAGTARGQRRPYYQNPPLSPYLDLYRRDSGVLDNYHTFVRPQLELYRTLGRQDATLQRQDASIYQLGQDVSEYERTGASYPTGTGSSFMNYLHFYPMQGGVQGRR